MCKLNISYHTLFQTPFTADHGSAYVQLCASHSDTHELAFIQVVKYSFVNTLQNDGCIHPHVHLSYVNNEGITGGVIFGSELISRRPGNDYDTIDNVITDDRNACAIIKKMSMIEAFHKDTLKSFLQKYSILVIATNGYDIESTEFVND